jgi:uncharacterized membrane protein AbrB (regulator of aidB expression)
MIARAINPSVFGVLFNNWALVLAILLTTLAISGLTGWLLVRYSALPGATGAWGSSPGGASAMVVMAQEYGADVRLVALMQYLRVLFVVGAAALVVRYALGNEAQEMTQDIVWFPSLTLNFPFTLLLTARPVGWACGCASLRGHAVADAARRAGPGQRLDDAGAAGVAAGDGLCGAGLDGGAAV